MKENIVHLLEADRAAGFLQLEKARVRWFLSINEAYLPDEVKKKGQRTFRAITVDGNEVEFSEGFGNLHTRSYEEILKGNGFGLAEALPSINIVHDIRVATPVAPKGEYHPLIKA